ncbi:MAG: T9SS type A sorting domain-containing protein [Bacteroidia bacterium]
MKTTFLFLSLFITNLFFGQTVKILFDATKAESAGNADWVIDSDLHNLGFGSGPAVTGSGDESNPQRFPTPAQSGITSSTPETFWAGSLSSWGVDCVKRGYSVETLPYNVAITYGSSSNPQDLSNYKVFIVCEPNIVFTAAEKTAIMLFVQNGGGLFMVSDHDVSDRNGDGWDSPHIWNDLISSNSVQNYPFGITFDYANFSETSTNIPSLPGDSLLHGPMGNVTSVKWSNGTSMTLSTTQNSTVKGVVYKTGSSFGSTNVMMAYARFGMGKVAALSDSSPPDDGTGDPNDALYNGWTLDAGGNHERLIMNATIWLATTNAVTTGIESNTNNNIVNVFPNPTDGIITLNFEEKSEHISIEIMNELGQSVYNKKINDCMNGYIQNIDLSALSKGSYFLKIMADNTIQVKKILLVK